MKMEQNVKNINIDNANINNTNIGNGNINNSNIGDLIVDTLKTTKSFQVPLVDIKTLAIQEQGSIVQDNTKIIFGVFLYKQLYDEILQLLFYLLYL